MAKTEKDMEMFGHLANVHAAVSSRTCHAGEISAAWLWRALPHIQYF